MVKLTETEQAMLDGEMGRFKQVALQKIIEYAQVLGAEALCPVTKATVYLGAHPYLDVVGTDDYDEIFSKMLLCSGETIPLGEFDSHCTCQTCVAPCDQYVYEPLGLTKRFFEKNSRFLALTRDAGVSIAGSCTPYLTGWLPLYGEHFVTTESSNVIMCNAVLGACGNSDGLEAAAWSAICGRTPLWGNHIRANRLGTHVFYIDCPSESALDWDIIGYTLGKMLPPHAIPILAGDFARPDLVKLKQCFASLATTSGAEMCHIVGITPEAVTLEMALGGRVPKGVFHITQADYDRSMALLCDTGSGPVDFITLGCPHYSLEEVREAALYLKDKQVKKGVRLMLWTDMSTKAMADANGFTAHIEKAGAYLLTSACPLVIGRHCHEGVVGMAMDGAKQAHYIRSETQVPVYYGDKYQCIDAAITGRWEVRR